MGMRETATDVDDGTVIPLYHPVTFASWMISLRIEDGMAALPLRSLVPILTTAPYSKVGSGREMHS
jgi:hypothetical protein